MRNNSLSKILAADDPLLKISRLGRNNIFRNESSFDLYPTHIADVHESQHIIVAMLQDNQKYREFPFYYSH